VDSERGLLDSAIAEYPLYRQRSDPEYATQSPLGEYYLWCEHRAKGEAAEITEAARRNRLEVINWCGGVSEWGFSKLLHWLRRNPSRRGNFGCVECTQRTHRGIAV